VNAPNDSLPPLLLDRPDDIRALRKALDAAGFNHKGVLDVLGADGVTTFGKKDTMVCAWRTREKTALNALIRRFILGNISIGKALGENGAGRERRPRPGRSRSIDAWIRYLRVPTSSFTAATDLSIIACSSALSLNSITFSTPPAPNTVGTPTKYPFTPNSPFR